MQSKNDTKLNMGNGSSRSNLDNTWLNIYQSIKSKHDNAYTLIEEAISLEEQEKSQEAIEKYKEGILQIDLALKIQVTCPENPDFTWEKACVMIQKMKKTRAEVLTRINSIQSSFNFVPVEPPPSYDEATACSSSSSMSPQETPRTYKELASALENLQVESKALYNRTTILYTHDNVRLYIISPTGQTLSTSEPETLTIAVIEGEKGTEASTFLQIGSWVYPLVPGVSPCYRTNYGAFILPDLHSDVPGSSIGIILPPDADSDVYDLLENILHGVVSQTAIPFRRGQTEIREEPGLSDTISKGLVNGAYYLSKGLIKGAEKASNMINNKTPEIVNRMTPASQATRVNPKIAKGMKIAGAATNGAVQVTGFVANKVGMATTKLGKFLAPHIQRHGTRILTTGFNMSEQEASSKMNSVLTVAAGAVEGFSTVYNGLETSASILAQSLKENTVKVVDHKYGGPAGEVTSDTLTTLGNVVTVNRNLHMFTPKGLAKETAKGAGRAVVEDHRRKVNMNSNICTDMNMPSTSNSMNNMNHIYSNDNTSTVRSIQGPLLSPSKSDDFLPEKK